MTDYFICPHCLSIVTSESIIDDDVDMYIYMSFCGCFRKLKLINPWDEKDSNRRWYHNPNHFTSYL